METLDEPTSKECSANEKLLEMLRILRTPRAVLLKEAMDKIEQARQLPDNAVNRARVFSLEMEVKYLSKFRPVGC